MKHLHSLVITVLVLISQQADAQLWGSTATGGTNNAGVVFKTTTSGTGYTVIKNFLLDPEGSPPSETRLLKANGKLYGTTLGGGVKNGASLFEFNPADGAYTVLHAFNPTADGYQPRGGLTLGSNGKLYGTTSVAGAHGTGTIFSYDAGTFTNLHDFDYSVDGSGVVDDLVEFNGKFYGVIVVGTANGAGAIFEYNPGNGIVTVKYSFSGASGTFPRSIRLHSNGKMYGTTFTGVIFEYDPTLNAYAKKADILSEPLVEAPNGKMYGTTTGGGAFSKGSIFEFDPASGTVTRLYDFSADIATDPLGVLVVGSDGKLYGHTIHGGASNKGVLYSYEIGSPEINILVEFNADRGTPNGSLMEESTGKIYGSTFGGGVQNAGTLYEYDYLAPAFTKKFDFKVGLDGGGGGSGMVLASNGKLYGASGFGGQHNGGTLFEIDPASDAFVKKFDFSNDTGTGSLLPTVYENSLIGATQNGDNGGMIYSYDLANTVTPKVELKPLGFSSVSKFVLAPNTKMYATALENSKGIIVEYDVPTNTLMKKTALGGTLTPSGGLSLATDGALYGGTNNGGANGNGLLYKYVPGEASITTVFDLSSTTGSTPTGSFVSPGNGKMYGITFYGGTLGSGTLFEYDLGSKAFTVKHDFISATGTQPASGLIISNGKLYGTAFSGGANSKGVMFEYDYTGNQYTNLHDFDDATGSFPYGVTLAVSQQSQQIFFLPPADQKLSNGSFELTAISSSGLPLTIVSSDPSIAEVNGKTVTIKTLGTVTLTASQTGTSAFSAATNVDRSLTIIMGDQTITFGALPSKQFADANFQLTGTSDTGLPLSYTSSDLTVATVSGSEVIIVGVGSTTITASQAGNSNYNPAVSVPQTLTVVKTSQTITWPNLAPAVFGDANITLTATTTSGLPITYSSDNTAVTTVSGNQLTIVGAGTAVITASQGGDGNYLAAVSVPHSLVVAKGTQTITLDPIPDKTLGDAAFTVHGVASSGLTLTYSSASDKVSVTGSEVTLLKAGSTTVIASQAGDANYLPVQTSVNFCVRPAMPTITQSGSGAGTILTSSSTAGNQWMLNGNSINNETNATLSVTVAGTYTVVATIEGCTSAVSDGLVVVITGDITIHRLISVFPSPADDRLIVNLPGNFRARMQMISADGRTLEDLTTDLAQIEFNVGSYASGVYLLKVNDGEITKVVRWVKR